MKSPSKKKIWIDLDNSPHVLFFKPIMEELVKRGYSLTVTARDCFQVCGLADLMGIKYTPIGKHYGKHKVMKILGTLIRVVQLMPLVLRERPAIAVSHGSRTQQLLSGLLRIPNIIIFDYEHSTPLKMFEPTCFVVPEMVVGKVTNVKKSPIRGYPGIKEDVYVPGFKPDPRLRQELGLDNDDIVAVIRPPASEAHYRSPESEKLFTATVHVLSARKDVKMIMLPRNEKQEKLIRSEWSELFSQRRIVIPEKVVDGLNLIWNADLVISGGGTMNREAAALGVPVYSIFRGKTGAVDRYLADAGRLVLIENPDDLQRMLVIEPRNKQETYENSTSRSLQSIVGIITEICDKSVSKA